METSIRNALGDIGNRLGLGNVQFGAGKNELALKPSELPVKQQPAVFKVPKTAAVVKQPSSEEMRDSEEAEAETSKAESSACMMSVEQDETNDIEIDEEIDALVSSSDDDDDDEVVDGDEELDSDVDAVLDIDAGDEDNPQLCSIYANEIYDYLTALERKYRISPHFLDKKVVTTKMRSVLIDWLVQVHIKFQLLQETMFLTVHLIDAYLERVDVSRQQLQLVGVTAMFLASKYEEMYVPAIEDFVYMTDNTYTKAEIRRMEVDMCTTLGFAFGKPLPLHFLRRFSKAAAADPKQHTLAKYFMELSMHDHEFAAVDPSYLAACSLYLSFKLLGGSHWSRTLEYYSNYKERSLWSGMQKLAALCHRAMDASYKYKAATNKYAHHKFMRISTLPELSGKFMKELAAAAAAAVTTSTSA